MKYKDKVEQLETSLDGYKNLYELVKSDKDKLQKAFMAMLPEVKFDNILALFAELQDLREQKKQWIVDVAKKIVEPKQPIKKVRKPRQKKIEISSQQDNTWIDQRGVKHYRCVKCRRMCSTGQLLCKRCKGE